MFCVCGWTDKKLWAPVSRGRQARNLSSATMLYAQKTAEKNITRKLGDTLPFHGKQKRTHWSWYILSASKVKSHLLYAFLGFTVLLHRMIATKHISTYEYMLYRRIIIIIPYLPGLVGTWPTLVQFHLKFRPYNIFCSFNIV